MEGQSIIIILLLLAVLATLVVGVVVMAIGGKLNKKYSTKLMSLRVFLQALAVLLLGLLFLFS